MTSPEVDPELEELGGPALDPDADPDPADVDDAVVEGPDGEVSAAFVERTHADEFAGEIVKGGGIESSPGAMQALARGGVPAWQAYLDEHTPR